MEDIRKGVCPLCKHNEILEAKPFALVETAYGTKPPAIAMISPTAGGFSAAFKRALNDQTENGEWVTYACRSCGFSQTFVINCSGVAIGKEYGTRLIKGPEPEGPYR